MIKKRDVYKEDHKHDKDEDNEDEYEDEFENWKKKIRVMKDEDNKGWW